MEKAYDDQPRLKLFETDSIFDSPTKKVLVFILLRGTIVSRTYVPIIYGIHKNLSIAIFTITGDHR